MSRPSASAWRIAPRSAFPQARVRRRERVAARQRADRGRHGRTRGSFLALGVEERRRLVGLEGAERSDARQQQASPAACREQRLGERLSRALRRHVDRRVGQRHRPARAGEAVDQHAVQERAAQCRQKRRPGGNREDSRRAMGHARLLCGAAREGKRAGSKERLRLTLSAPPRAFAMRSRRPEFRIAASPERLRTGG